MYFKRESLFNNNFLTLSDKDWRKKELYKKKKTLMKNMTTSHREQGKIIHQIEVFKVDRIATFKTFLSEKVLSCRTICLVFVLIVIYSLLYKGWVWLFVGLSVSKRCNKRWVWTFGEIDWSQSREVVEIRLFDYWVVITKSYSGINKTRFFLPWVRKVFNSISVCVFTLSLLKSNLHEPGSCSGISFLHYSVDKLVLLSLFSILDLIVTKKNN